MIDLSPCKKFLIIILYTIKVLTNLRRKNIKNFRREIVKIKALRKEDR